eukprot:CAMPEP_0196665650 /NCGR_PEP_ID=MMETSP1086-20130531/62003_1 /TAXON_ID=77921 /ORGANISM="Cyanoptyche  gloeocystis , Strain SAG4.97" /LENGTH=564 /DNA_ID=CAMNT_0042002519 /DNA_START=81 /DNA_END=1775 /DNA_ORIENTATION=-
MALSELRKHLYGRAANIELDMILKELPSDRRKTKIICTLGIKTSTVDALCEMIASGMNIARLNFSHGDHETHGAAIKNIREACARTHATVGIVLDTKGPEIRTGLLEDGKPVDIVKGQKLKLATDYTMKGNSGTIAVSWANLPLKVSPGGQILVADGGLTLKVDELHDDHVICTAQNDFKLGEKKNMNCPGADVDIETITKKDREDLAFGVKMGVDIIAASFVRCAADIAVIKEALGPDGKDIKIISKIENQQGLKNFDEILAACDGIMVARGDMGMEIPPEKVFLAQKMMIRKCNVAGKPVITATQMLESMIKSPRPTRAEATDVANAVFDGTDCVMLSGETASGDYPLQAITIMSRICLEAEQAVNYNQVYLTMRYLTTRPVSVTEGMASSAVEACLDRAASMIIVESITGNAARLLSKYSPPVPVVVVTLNEQVGRQCQLSWGLTALVESNKAAASRDLIDKALAWGLEHKVCKAGDFVVSIHAKGQLPASGTTSMLEILQVRDGKAEGVVLSATSAIRQYLHATVYETVTEGLVELCRVMPPDPVSYLGSWLKDKSSAPQ